MRDREALFSEYVVDIKRKDKESSRTKHDKVGLVYWDSKFAGLPGMVIRP
jgi:hypothetical protein